MNCKYSAITTLGLAVVLSQIACAQDDKNPEDQDILDPAIPTAPISPHPPSNAGNTPPPNPAGGIAPDMIMVPRSEWEQMKRDIEELKKSRDQASHPSPGTLPAPATSPSEIPPPVESNPTQEATNQPVGGGHRSLLLPDISLIMQAKGLGTTDRRDSDRGAFRLSEGELAIQSYVYPNVRADAYIVGAPAEDESLQFEEGFLTFVGLCKGLNLNIGRKFVPFGRTGELHNHSWLYARQLLPIRNLVAEEALVGDGVNFNYLLPLKGKTFVRASLGVFHGEGPGDISLAPFPNEIVTGPGSGFHNRFVNGRLWLGHPVGGNGELEVGVSHARGKSLLRDENETILGRGRVNLSGADISYRRFMSGNKRLLLRSEYFANRPSGGLPTARANGYYLLSNLRYKPRNDIGLLYENSGFPQATNTRERAWSLIYTKQLTEQFYMRLQGTRGNRPGRGNYNEALLQFTWGVGPHTHTLE